ncbi:hypothetical protein H4O21_25140 [Oceanospirillum sp. D5]|uniref:Uncharacterized protein n=1 Tax=Oceanospirillum sediminis TaxID=2760088 RepID=A0A839IWX3_9GAMM|nr:hypothetical protein [Oceanospirillum sediminis]
MTANEVTQKVKNNIDTKLVVTGVAPQRFSCAIKMAVLQMIGIRITAVIVTAQCREGVTCLWYGGNADVIRGHQSLVKTDQTFTD